MLKFIYGRAATGKTTKILELIEKDAIDQKEVVYIVPEQFSFESERAILDLLSDKNSLNISVYSFSLLADTLTKLLGGSAKRVLSDSEKILFMSKTLKALEERLDIFKKFIHSPLFASKIVDMIGEFKISAVFPDDLSKACGSLEGSLKEKIEALTLIYRTYDALVNEKHIDPADKLEKLYDDLLKNKFFKGKNVYIDGFKGFTGQQFRIINLILSQADNVTVSALCTDKDSKKIDMFTNTRKMLSSLEESAKRYNVSVGEHLYFSSHYYKGEGVDSVEKILCGQKGQFGGQGVAICKGKTISDEVSFVARNIRKLVRENGYRYKDFVVIARNAKEYETEIERQFLANDISCFFDKRVPITISPVFTVIDAAICCAQKCENSEIFRFLKTGLVDTLTEDEISALENYVFLWDIKGKDWEKEWDMDPTGFSKTEENDKEIIENTLKSINEARIKATKYLFAFREKFSGSVKDRAEAVVNLLKSIKTASKAGELVDGLSEIFSSEDIDAIRQSWDIIMDILDSLVKSFGQDIVSSKEFCDMFRLAAMTTTVGRIPQMLDEVTFGEAERIRPSRPKVAFIMGANQGVFPALPDNGSILGYADRKTLIEKGVNVRDKAFFQTVEEELLVYSSLCCASEGLFITYRESKGGENQEPSAFIETLKEQIKDIKVYCEPDYDLSEDNLPETKSSAFNVLCDSIGNNAESRNTLLQAVIGVDELKEKLGSVISAGTERDMFLSKENARKLFGSNLSLSATKFDTYHSCRFRFFCRYGLKCERLQQAKLDNLQRGTIVHYVLEQFCNNHLEDIGSVDKETISKEVDHYTEQYFSLIMGSEFLFTVRFEFLVNTIKKGLTEVIERIVSEFAQSCFRPEKCEVSIGNNSTIPTVVFPFGDDGKMSLYGSIDRLDRWESYIRIVDYKTGSKVFKLSDTLYGLNLQMLLYLYCVIRGDNPDYKGKKPAGILYLPSKRDIKKEGLAMNGLINSNIDVIKAMEKEHEGKYIPKLTLTSKGQISSRGNGSFIAEEAFEIIFDYIEKLAKDMGENLSNGSIEVNPVDGAETEACKYCDYKSVCKIENKEHFKALKLDNQEVINMMSEVAENEIR